MCKCQRLRIPFPASPPSRNSILELNSNSSFLSSCSHRPGYCGYADMRTCFPVADRALRSTAMKLVNASPAPTSCLVKNRESRQIFHTTNLENKPTLDRERKKITSQAPALPDLERNLLPDSRSTVHISHEPLDGHRSVILLVTSSPVVGAISYPLRYRNSHLRIDYQSYRVSAPGHLTPLRCES